MSGARIVKVAEEDDGQRLDRWLKKRAPEIPYGLLQKLIRKGAIKIDGKKAKTDSRLTAGQEIRLPVVEERGKAPGEKAAKKGMKLDAKDAAYIKSLVLQDDGDIVVFNKPGDIASQGGGGVERHIDGLLELMKDRKDRRPRLIHRLDRDTSGVLLCARSPEAVRNLGKSFSSRQAQKIYWAVVTPAPGRDEGTIKAPLAKGTGALKDRMYVDEGDESKTAITDFVVIDRVGTKAAFVAFLPRTGRTHQIRVHAADVLGCPIVGDGKYGGAAATVEGMDLSDRLHLHARRLVLPHPKGKGMLDFTAPLPPDMKKSFKILGFDPNASSDME